MYIYICNVYIYIYMYVYIYTYHICIFNLDRHATILAAPLPRAYAFSQRKVIEIADWSSHKKKWVPTRLQHFQVQVKAVGHMTQPTTDCYDCDLFLFSLATKVAARPTPRGS